MPRHSKQRDAVYEELRGRKDHPTAEELYLSLKKTVPSMSLATVYRNLGFFEEEKLVVRIGSGGSARYDADLSDHQHLLCTECGSVTDIMMECGELCGRANALIDGKAESCQVLFKGICSDCLNRK